MLQCDVRALSLYLHLYNLFSILSSLKIAFLCGKHSLALWHLGVTQCIFSLLKLFYQMKNDYNSTLLLFLQ